MPEIYKNIILTTHASERLRQRSIDVHEVAETIAHPDKKFSDSKTTTKFIRTDRGRKYHVVGQWKPSERKWLVLSAWVRGENDSEPLYLQLVYAPFRLLWWLLRMSTKKN
jgi:hypothetical protein